MRDGKRFTLEWKNRNHENPHIPHNYPALEVIHGHGSGSGISRIKPQVLSALHKQAVGPGGELEQDGGNPGAQVPRFR